MEMSKTSQWDGIDWDVFKVIFYFLPWDSSPSNHHVGEYVLFFSSQLKQIEVEISVAYC